MTDREPAATEEVGHDRPSPISLRLVAAVIDFTVVMVLVVVTVTIGEAFGSGKVGNAVALALVGLYPTVSVGAFGRTVGKRLCNLVVRSRAGRAPGWTRAVVRFLVTAAPFVIPTVVARRTETDWVPDVVQFALAAAVYAPILFGERRLGLHDRIAGTEVVCTVAPLAGIAEQLAARQAERFGNP